MKELKDYLHLYLGCEVLVEGDIRKLITIYLNGYVEVNYNDIGGQEFPINEIKPILRPLSDMTEEEFYEFTTIANEDCSKTVRVVNIKEMNANILHQFEACRYLISKHFDLFGLIEAGLAIDGNTLNQDK